MDLAMAMAPAALAIAASPFGIVPAILFLFTPRPGAGASAFAPSVPKTKPCAMAALPIQPLVQRAATRAIVRIFMALILVNQEKW